MFSAPVLDVNENTLEEIELDLGDIDPEIIAALGTGDEIFVPSRDIFLDEHPMRFLSYLEVFPTPW